MTKETTPGPVWLIPVGFLAIAIVISASNSREEKNRRQDPFPVNVTKERKVCAANNCMQQIEAESLSSGSTYELHKYHEPWVSVGDKAFAIRVYDRSYKGSLYHYELYEESE